MCFAYLGEPGAEFMAGVFTVSVNGGEVDRSIPRG